MRPPSRIRGDGFCTSHGTARKLDADQPGIDDDFVVSRLGGGGGFERCQYYERNVEFFAVLRMTRALIVRPTGLINKVIDFSFFVP